MAAIRTKSASRVTFYISEATFYIVKLKFLASSSSIPVKLPSSTLSFNFGAHRHRLAKESGKRPSNMQLFEKLYKKNRHEGDWRDARSVKAVHVPVTFANVVDPALDLHLDPEA
ncbi:hypothetical protein CTI12_AA534960 [Artemisia annua]|uniref:Uncharacterized protein n=1 Tax=Artemisia annua TaxID=35608 RepID=A0A2U1L2W1_ARTAN|nr:hypothetical protein CTI12_AA534960 [Artemisia annua]